MAIQLEIDTGLIKKYFYFFKNFEEPFTSFTEEPEGTDINVIPKDICFDPLLD